MTTQFRSDGPGLSLAPILDELAEAVRVLCADVAAGTVGTSEARDMVSRWMMQWRDYYGRFPLRWHAMGAASSARRCGVTLTPDGWRWRTYYGNGSIRDEGHEATEMAARAAADRNMGVSSPAPSVPEPAPLPLGEPITPALVAWLSARGLTRAGELVTARDAYGRAKYGQPLRLDDGRDAVEDCRQELGDALQYAYRALRRGDDTRELMALAQALVRLLAEGVGRG